MKRFVEWPTEPYWRFRWWVWAVSVPDPPSVYNTLHKHQITNADHHVMMERWQADEPKRGVPPSVRKHRENYP